MTYKEIYNNVWQVVTDTPEELKEFLHSTNSQVVYGDKPADEVRDEYDDLMDMF